MIKAYILTPGNFALIAEATGYPVSTFEEMYARDTEHGLTSKIYVVEKKDIED